MSRVTTPVAALFVAVLASASCSDASSGAAPTPNTTARAALTTTVEESSTAVESTVAATTDAALPELDDLPPLTRFDPLFSSSEPCRAVEAHYRHRVALDVVNAGATLDDVRSATSTHAALLDAIAATTLADEVPAVRDGFAIEEAFAQRLADRWGSDGGELFDEARSAGTTVFRLLLSEPVVDDGRTVSHDGNEAAELVEMVEDQLVLACTTVPDGWSPVAADPNLEPAPLTFVAGTDSAQWFSLRLDDPADAGDLAVADYLSLEPSPSGDRLVASRWPDRTVEIIDPRTWSAEPVADAGSGWSCPSWTVDGAAILGDLIDPTTGERSPVRYTFGDETGPEPLPASAGSCPKSIGPDEVVAVGDSTLLGVTFDGDERELLAMDRCNLVPIDRPHNGMLDVYANCANPYLDGLHQLDLETGDVSQLITGRVGAGDLSPDGRWRVFGYVPHDEPGSEISLWVLDQETGRAGPLDGLQAYYPVFVPD